MNKESITQKTQHIYSQLLCKSEKFYSTVCPRYNEFGVQANQAFVICKFSNTITNFHHIILNIH